MMRLGFTIFASIAFGLTAAAEGSPHAAPSPQDVERACINMTGDRMPPATRTSPLDSVSFTVQGKAVKVCFGRPSARGRAIMGGLVQYDKLWRTGANEPTMIHTSVALEIAGLTVEPGSYSLYTVPGETEWTVIVNRSITQWGHEGRYTSEVEAQEVGRASVAAGKTSEFVETFTISAVPVEDGDATLRLEWEWTRVEIPISGAG